MKRFFSLLTLLAVLAAPLAANAFTLGPTTPGKWGSPVMGTGATVTWSYLPNGGACGGEGCAISHLSGFMPVGYQTAVNNAFAAWSAVANINFVHVVGGPGDIRLGMHTFDGPGGVLAHGYYPPVNGGGLAGDIHFDQADLWKLGFGGPGFDLFQVLAHEIGHAIGLAHSGVPSSLMNPFYTEAFSGLRPDDIAGAQFIYGRRPQQVPEPSALFLAGLALAGLALSRRAAR